MPDRYVRGRSGDALASIANANRFARAAGSDLYTIGQNASRLVAPGLPSTSGFPIDLVVGGATLATTPSGSYRGDDATGTVGNRWPAEYGPNLVTLAGSGATFHVSGFAGAPSPFNLAVDCNGTAAFVCGSASLVMAPEAGGAWYDIFAASPATFAVQNLLWQSDAGTSHRVNPFWSTSGRFGASFRDGAGVLVNATSSASVFAASTWYYLALAWRPGVASGLQIFCPQVNQSAAIASAGTTTIGSVAPTITEGHVIGGTSVPASVCTDPISLVRCYKFAWGAQSDADRAAAATDRARALGVVA